MSPRITRISDAALARCRARRTVIVLVRRSAHGTRDALSRMSGNREGDLFRHVVLA
jgi:hypothetical protein